MVEKSATKLAKEPRNTERATSANVETTLQHRSRRAMMGKSATKLAKEARKTVRATSASVETTLHIEASSNNNFENLSETPFAQQLLPEAAQRTCIKVGHPPLQAV